MLSTRADICWLTGIDDSHIDRSTYQEGLHPLVVPAFGRLKQAAKTAGFDLAIASGFRPFDRQLTIWNEKIKGLRPVLDSQGLIMDVKQLKPWPLVQAILRWSALPGASRHHWGTDIDIYDRAAVDVHYRVQLSAEEVDCGGPFFALHAWLDEQIDKGKAEGFFRPYARDTGGVAPERWHISYAPLADSFQKQLTLDVLTTVIAEQQTLLHRGVILEHREEIYRRFVLATTA